VLDPLPRTRRRQWTLPGRVATPSVTTIELAVGGMTCAACAARVQRKLDRLDGVSSRVSYATERATLEVAPGVAVATLIETVERTGYTARLVTPAAEDPSSDRSD
jgi:Cu+-exporting ATPase